MLARILGGRVVTLLSLASLVAACGGDGQVATDARRDRGALVDGPHADRGGATVDHGAITPDRTLPPAPDTGKPLPYVHEDFSVQTLNTWLASGKALTLVDVREASEYSGGHIASAINLAWNSGVLQKSTAQIPQSKPVVVYCASGNRSNAAATFLAGQGYKPVHDMLGGINAWKGAGYPVVQ
jgi:rhodanese-related sulfurtransferase